MTDRVDLSIYKPLVSAVTDRVNFCNLYSAPVGAPELCRFKNLQKFVQTINFYSASVGAKALFRVSNFQQFVPPIHLYSVSIGATAYCLFMN